MKPITIFVLESCPYCKEALAWIEELKKYNPEYKDIEIIKIDEWREPEIANSYDYYYVPTCYMDGVKVHEGAATKEIVKKILDAAIK